MSDLPTPMERSRRGREVLAVVLTGVFGEEQDFVPVPGKWGIRQIVAHVAHGELVMAHRFRQVTAEDNPTLSAFAEDAWSLNLDYGANRSSPRKASAASGRRTMNYGQGFRKAPSSTPAITLGEGP